MKKVFILDIDGVFTDGGFYYDKQNGKIFKKFNSDDREALDLLNAHGIEAIFVSSDVRGFDISSKRIEDMNRKLEFVKSGKYRLQWIKERYDVNNVIYMGDSFTDAIIFKEIAGITTNDADPLAKKYAKHIVSRNGGHRAVSEACFYLAEKYLNLTPEEFVGM